MNWTCRNTEPAKKILRWCRFDARLLLRHLHFPSGATKKLANRRIFPRCSSWMTTPSASFRTRFSKQGAQKSCWLTAASMHWQGDDISA